MNDISTSAIVMTIPDLEKLVAEYRNKAIEAWKVDAPAGLRKWAEQRSKYVSITRSLKHLFTAKPTVEAILADMEANRDFWMVEADIRCRRRLAQADFFIRICEEFNHDPNISIHLSFEDFNMMKNNDYGHYGRWNWHDYDIPEL